MTPLGIRYPNIFLLKYNHVHANVVVFMKEVTPLRIQFGTVCQLLDVTREALRHTIRKDPTFPAPLKMGTTKQSPVFFDYQELVEWLWERE